MTECSFFHIEGYGRKPLVGKRPKPALDGVVAEAERRPGFCAHVASPLPPQILLGITPTQAAEFAVEQASRARNAASRRIRSIDIVMYAGVVSYPVEAGKVVRRHGDKAEVIDPLYTAWLKENLVWLAREFGDALVSVVEHLDEAYPHVHFYVQPPLEEGRLRLDRVHRGRRAQVGVTDKSEQGRVYCFAMSRWLDDYQAAVGASFGHERFGPKRMRTSRWWQMEKRRVQNQANAVAEAARLAAERSVVETKKKLHSQLLLLKEELCRTSDTEALQLIFHAERRKLQQRLDEADKRAALDARRIAKAGAMLRAAGLLPDIGPGELNAPAACSAR
ncbi:hypothetical protein ACFQI3_07380 [Hansschlegelia quercus]|uniref:Plasmid recombination enzyme n=1 Tax=Hansschlegelia quercus TaxID=2528245 RepID=A0A4V2JE23_9HYPH|nr:hypothetical protein [Hansschlegelia quercus]TBN53636.1 hypothetical protein EYR15_07460 [Hansschlegelia quercus]